MARLPQPGGDSGQWGNILNDFLTQAHKDDGSLKDNIVSASTITPSAGSDGQVLTYDGAVSGGLKWAAPAATSQVTMGGAITGPSNNTQITAGVVGTAEIAGASVTNVKLADGAVTTSKLSAASPASGQVLSYNGSGLAWMTPASTAITDGSIGAAKLQTNAGTDGQVLVLDSAAAGGFTWSTLSLGSATPTGAAGGDLSGTYPNPALANDAVTTVKIADTNVTTAKLADGAVSTAKLADGSVTSAKIVDGAIQESDLAASIVTKLNNSGVIADGTVTPVKLDTNGDTPANGELLTYNATSQKFEWSAPSAQSNDINNQYTAAQTAEYWITGRARAEGQTTLGGASDQAQVVVRASGAQSPGNPHLLLTDGTGAEVGRVAANPTGVFAGQQSGVATTGQNNTAYGAHSLQQNTTGTSNTAVGFEALRDNQDSNNVAVGSRALYQNTTGSSNTATGHLSLASNTTGNNLSAFGASSLSANTTGVQNTAVGKDALLSNTDGSWNTAIGSAALAMNTTGGASVAIGDNTLADATTGSANTAVGQEAMRRMVDGVGNVAAGHRALFAATDATGVVAIGRETLRDNLASHNVGVGALALNQNTTGTNNIAIGSNAMFDTTTGRQNIAIGRDAMYHNTDGINNSAVGHGALRLNTTGTNNVALGAVNMEFNTTGEWNASVGSSALQQNTTGAGNAALGSSALVSNTTGFHNTAVGDSALRGSTTGSNNTGIGYQAGYADNGGLFKTPAVIANSTAIGSFAQVTRDNSLTLGSVDLQTRVGVGITSPTALFSVSPVRLNGSSVIATQSGNTVTSSNVIFSATNVGETLVWADDGATATVTGFTSPTTITVDTTATKSTPTQFRTHRPTLHVDDQRGNIGINTITPDPTHRLDVNGSIKASGMYVNDLNIGWDAAPPVNANSPGIPGEKAYDNDYLYICIAPDTWKRTSLATW